MVLGGAVVLARGSGSEGSGTAGLSTGGVVDGGTDDVEGVPVLSDAYRTEGELADGLTVPPGTALLGDVLPARPFLFEGLAEGDGWEAFLLVVGDMAAVLDDLDGQVARLGMEPVSDGHYTGCGGSQYQPGEGVVECRAGWLSDELAVSAVLVRGVVEEGSTSNTSRPVSLLTLEVVRLDGSGATTTVAPSTTTAAPAPNEPLPPDWPEPPGPGEHLGDGIVSPDTPEVLSLRLPEGANAVVAPWPRGGAVATYGAVVAVTGDSDQVLVDLAEQIDGHFESSFQDSSQEIDGTSIRTIQGDNAGGDLLELVATTVGDRTWITVSTSYD